jgi:hypothetical protein
VGIRHTFADPILLPELLQNTANRRQPHNYTRASATRSDSNNPEPLFPTIFDIEHADALTALHTPEYSVDQDYGLVLPIQVEPCILASGKDGVIFSRNRLGAGSNPIDRTLFT